MRRPDSVKKHFTHGRLFERFLGCLFPSQLLKNETDIEPKIAAEHLGIKQLHVVMVISFKTMSWLIILTGFQPVWVCLSPHFGGYSSLCVHWLLTKYALQ